MGLSFQLLLRAAQGQRGERWPCVATQESDTTGGTSTVPAEAACLLEPPGIPETPEARSEAGSCLLRDGHWCPHCAVQGLLEGEAS